MRKILIVEDEALIALDLAEQLGEAGFAVAGPAGSAAKGLELIESADCDAAVLDVNLGRETSEAVALELTRRKIPFVTVSGYTSDQHPPAFRGSPCLAKPLRISELVRELRVLLALPAAGPGR